MKYTAIILGIWLLIASWAARAADETLALEVTLNGRPTQLIAEFTLRDGALYATASNCRRESKTC